MDAPQLFGLGDAVYLVSVAALWGVTNVLLKKNSAGIDKIDKKGNISQTFAEFIFLVTNWKYLVSFLLNQTGSVVYYITLSTADLTLAVPVTNSLTFIFTAVTSHILGENRLNLRTLIGMGLVILGVLLCVLSKVDTVQS